MASGLVIGVVMMQERHVFAFESRKLKYTKFNYFVYENELLVVVNALNVWQYFVLEKKIKIKIDHQSLRDNSTPPNLSGSN